MKTTTALLLGLILSLLGANTVIAQDFSFRAQSMVRSKYIGPDDGLLFYGDPVVHSNVTLTHNPTGLFLDVWHSTGFNTNLSGDWDDEVDVTLGLNKTFGKASFTFALAYYDDFDLGHGPVNDVVKAGVRIAYEPQKVTSWLTVTLFASYTGFFIPDSATTFDGGTVLALGVDTEVKLTERWSIASCSALAWDDGAFGVKPGLLFRHTSTLNLLLNKHVTWNLIEATAYVPLGDRNMPNHLVWGTGLTVSF